MANAARPQDQWPLADLAVRPYRPRYLRFIRREVLGEWRLKVYGIATFGNQPRAPLVASTLRLAGEVLPKPALGDGCYGVGFVIAHDAATVSLALVYWWQSQNELHQRVFFGPRDDPVGLKPYANPGAGCVWELGIIDFERRAWLEDVLMNPKGPDIERYMGRQVDADV